MKIMLWVNKRTRKLYFCYTLWEKWRWPLKFSIDTLCECDPPGVVPCPDCGAGT